MSAAAAHSSRPLYDAGESIEQFAARQRQAFTAFELAWREGRVSLKLKGYYDQLVRDVGANAYAWWSEERWADAFGVSASTIKRVLSALTTAGLIRRERQFGSSSRTYLTVYDRADADARQESGYTDNQQVPYPPRTTRRSQHDITKRVEEEEQVQAPNQNPEAPQQQAETSDYRYPAHAFFGVTSEPTIGSLLHHDPVKTRHLTIGAAGGHSPAAEADPLAHQVLGREGVADFVLAPQLAQQAVVELQAVSRYLDTQHTVRDRPRLFAWLATHGFGRQLLARRGDPSTRRVRDHAPPRRASLATPPVTPPPARPAPTHGALWSRVLEMLRTDGTAAELVMWLDGTVLLDVTDRAAVLGVPNVFVRDQVEQQYLPAIAARLASLLDRTLAITVVVDGCGGARLPRETGSRTPHGPGMPPLHTAP